MSMQRIDKAQLIKQLRRIVPNSAILSSEEELRPYECDGLSAYRRLPWLVVLPDNVEQIQAIVKCCRHGGIDIIARGAGTGLSGGVLPKDNAVILSLAKLNQILEIDPPSRTAVVQPGVRNLAISEAVAEHGLYYAPDPSSQIACTIGGNVAENSGGVHCLKYGLTVHNVLQIKVVCADGELVTLGGNRLDSTGYDLLALLHGSEGLLGIIVEVTVRLLPTPMYAQLIMAAFDDIANAGEAVGSIIANGIIPAGLEMMDNHAIRATEEFVQAGYPTDAAAILLCELDGDTNDVHEQIERVSALLTQCGATQLRISTDEAERLLLWQGRKAAFPAMGRISPDYYCMDGTIPRKQLSRVLQQIHEWSKEYELPVANVFHAGDGNLHPLILYDADKIGELERTEEFGARILELCVEVGGTITGEHGVGTEKLNQMCVQFQPLELQQFHALKKAFDPEQRLNPGKAIPSLHRCAELGAMHVHQGRLSHPELERF